MLPPSDSQILPSYRLSEMTPVMIQKLDCLTQSASMQDQRGIYQGGVFRITSVRGSFQARHVVCLAATAGPADICSRSL